MKKLKELLYILLVLLFILSYNIAKASTGPDIIYNGGHMDQYIDGSTRDKTFAYIFNASFSLINSSMRVKPSQNSFNRYTGINWYIKYPDTNKWLSVYNVTENQGEHGTTVTIGIPHDQLNGGTIGIACSFMLNGKIIKVTKEFNTTFMLQYRNGNNKLIDSAKLHEIEEKYQKIDRIYAKRIANIANIIFFVGIAVIPFLAFRRNLIEESKKNQEKTNDNEKDN